MKKPGGFRRCRVILADHPELYPLENICAWLHHETTGLWPNEGCHHPGMKNCRKKLKKGKRVIDGSLFSESDFNSRLVSRFGKDGHNLMIEDGDEEMGTEWSEQEFKDFEMALKKFIEDEPDFSDFLRDDESWEIEGEDDDDKPMTVPVMPKMADCECGCNKSAGKSDDIGQKAGRVISTNNMEKLRKAHELLSEIITVGQPAREVETKDDEVVVDGLDTDEAVRMLTPVARYHDLSVRVTDDGSVTIKSLKTDDARAAVNMVIPLLPRIFKGESKSLTGSSFVSVKPIIDYHKIPWKPENGVFVLDVGGISSNTLSILDEAIRVLGE